MSNRAIIDTQTAELEAKIALLRANDPFTKDVMIALNQLAIGIRVHNIGKLWFVVKYDPMPHPSPYMGWIDDKNNEWLAFDDMSKTGYNGNKTVPEIWKEQKG